MIKHLGYVKFICTILLVVLGGRVISKIFFTDKSDLEAVLCSAGGNQKELEKVLAYYQKNQSDSLKYRAACFLIENMPHYYSYAPNTVIDSLKHLKVKNIDRWIDPKIIKDWKWFNYKTLPKVKDIDVITADLLIENIEYAFMAWNKRSWSKYYSFEEFCEYILPYRIGDETLEKWRKIYYNRYSPILDSLYNGTDVVEASRKIVAYLQYEKFADRKDFDLPHMGALFLLKNRVGYCRDGCDIASYVLRSLGIPITMDMYCTSPSYHSRHFWSTIIDTTGLSIPFNYHEFLPKRGENNDRKRGKVYRHFFGIQKIDEDIAYDENVPNLFRNAFLRDVTDQYYPDSGFEVAVEGTAPNKYVYLSIYDFDKYVPIDIAVVNGKTARFKNVENGLIYFPVFYKDGSAYPAGYPFLLKKGSIPFYFIPDEKTLHSSVLNRKYPMRNNHKFLIGAVGMKFEGSTTLDFKDSRLLYEVVDTPRINYNRIHLAQPCVCRYIRVTQESERMELAEFEIYSEKKKIDVQKWGRKIKKLNKNSYEKMIFDGIWENYVVSFGEPIFFDIGKKECLTEIMFMPRNDDNFIHLGDTYELFYQNGVNGWISLGKQLADTTYLYYDNIPENSVLWLHNLTRGKEERPFYIENGKQIFP